MDVVPIVAFYSFITISCVTTTIFVTPLFLYLGIFQKAFQTWGNGKVTLFLHSLHTFLFFFSTLRFNPFQSFFFTLHMDSRGLKRKRSTVKKVVRFLIESPEIIYTYSSTEYDRGASPTLYKLNPIIPKLSLDIPEFDPDSSSNSSSPETPGDYDECPFASNVHNKKLRPKLSIDTSMCNGPLFFTKLSTNHRRTQTEEDSEYLVPMSAV